MPLRRVDLMGARAPFVADQNGRKKKEKKKEEEQVAIRHSRSYGEIDSRVRNESIVRLRLHPVICKLRETD